MTPNPTPLLPPARRRAARGLLALALPVLVASLLGCASAPGSDPRPQNITFLDTDAFDQSVQTALSQGSARIDIPLLAPASPNQLPARLSRLVSAVQDTGGQIHIQREGGGDDAQQAKGIGLLSLLPTLLEASAALRQKMLTRGYDVQLVLSQGQLTRLVLTPRR